jgi:peptidoglycan/LPS O-acetylase OafA/YrhL
MSLKLKWLNEDLIASNGIGPGFHFLRHALSLIIVAHHCRLAVFGVQGAAPGYVNGAPISEQLSSHLSPGLLLVELSRPALFSLVGLFFALSGFLVFASAARSPNIKTFFGNRAPRLLPALSVEVALSALILGPLVTELPLRAYFSDPQFFRYFGNIVGEVTFTLPGVFLHNPWPDLVNANLWTLPPELGCYLLMLTMLASGLTGHRRLLGALTVAALIAFQLLEIAAPDLLPVGADSTNFTPWFIVFLFVVGAACYANADLIPLHPRFFLTAAGLYWGLMLLGVLQCVAGIFLAYCMIYIGMSGFGWFDRQLKMDLSDGTYLYGFPLTQGAVHFVLPALRDFSHLTQYAIILPLVITANAIFAMCSWIVIEKPALSLRRHLVREPSPKLSEARAPVS